MNIRKIMAGLPIILCAALCIFIVTCFQIIITDGPSMEPTFHTGDHLLVIHDFRKPKEGDLVLIQHNDSLMVKRVLATSGQQAVTEAFAGKYEDIELGINTESGTNTFQATRKLNTWDSSCSNSISDSRTGLWTSYYYWSDDINALVPDGYIFVTGDNHNDSYDSRYKDFGLVPVNNVKGFIVRTLSRSN